MPPFCEICGAQDGRATFWFDAAAGGAYTPEVDDTAVPLNVYQICVYCQERFTVGQWTWSFTPNTLTVNAVSTGGQSSVIH